ncbi:MAG: hypothetical protein ACK5PS_02160 [Desulfopila sp.]
MTQATTIDVGHFLARITDQYLHLGRRASSLAMEIPLMHPEIIRHKCVQLNSERLNLAHQNEQLLTILQLAGEGPMHSAKLSRYRQAFFLAVKSFDTIYDQILSVRRSARVAIQHN